MTKRTSTTDQQSSLQKRLKLALDNVNKNIGKILALEQATNMNVTIESMRSIDFPLTSLIVNRNNFIKYLMMSTKCTRLDALLEYKTVLMAHLKKDEIIHVKIIQEAVAQLLRDDVTHILEHIPPSHPNASTIKMFPTEEQVMHVVRGSFRKGKLDTFTVMIRYMDGHDILDAIKDIDVSHDVLPKMYDAIVSHMSFIVPSDVEILKKCLLDGYEDATLKLLDMMSDEMVIKTFEDDDWEFATRFINYCMETREFPSQAVVNRLQHAFNHSEKHRGVFGGIHACLTAFT